MIKLALIWSRFDLIRKRTQQRKNTKTLASGLHKRQNTSLLAQSQACENTFSKFNRRKPSTVWQSGVGDTRCWCRHFLYFWVFFVCFASAPLLQSLLDCSSLSGNRLAFTVSVSKKKKKKEKKIAYAEIYGNLAAQWAHPRKMQPFRRAGYPQLRTKGAELFRRTWSRVQSNARACLIPYLK